MAIIPCTACSAPLIAHCHSTVEKGKPHPTCRWMKCPRSGCGWTYDLECGVRVHTTGTREALGQPDAEA